MNKCQVFTPEVIVDKMLDIAGYKGKKILKKYVLENSCGEGNILTKIVERYIKAAKRQKYLNSEIKSDLEKYIIAYDIDELVIKNCLLKLNKVCIKYGIINVKWQIKNSDYLKEPIDLLYDFIIGNPPYITYQEIRNDDRKYLRENYITCQKGKFDYCYAFIERSIKNLNDNGKMVYIIPNSIFKNSFAKVLREYMVNYLVSINDYKESNIFKNVLTSPAIIGLVKGKSKKTFSYFDEDKGEKNIIDKSSLRDKWIFTNKKVENSLANRSIKFGDLFKVSNSVATLLNDVFVIKGSEIIDEDSKYIYGVNYKIEKDILRDAASPKNKSLNKKEFIIFPYRFIEDVLIKYTVEEMEQQFPNCNLYLNRFLERLNKRKSDKNSKWFEYGRSQALRYLNQEKLMISSLITKEVRCYFLDKDTIPYSGFYIIPISDYNLEFARDILQSKEFLEYITLRGINANGISIRCSVKDIMNYRLDIK